MKEFQDFYFKKAKKEKHLARSIYKLDEIDKKYKIFKKGMSVIDLGCSPGSWLEYALSVVGDKGKIFGIDLKEVKKTFPPNVKTVKGDIYNLEAFEKSLKETNMLFADIVMSDMAPNTSGMKDVDAYRSYELCIQALIVADKFLKTGGTFITKIFQGEDFKNFIDIIKKSFNNYKIYKPKSSRSESVEVYVIGWSKKDKIAPIGDSK
jgi:23S rRNA (uridine2552-2'-O)-methyltransferase